MKKFELSKDMLKEDCLIKFNGIKFLKGFIYVIFGDSGTGKTAFVVSMSKEVLKKEYACIIISTELKEQDRDRFARLMDRFKNLKIYYIEKFSDFEEFVKNNLEKIIKKLNAKLVVIDSFSRPFQNYAEEKSSFVSGKEKAKKVKDLMNVIRMIAHDTGCTFVLTTHCYRKYFFTKTTVVPVGGSGLLYLSDQKFWIRFAKNPVHRIIRKYIDDTEVLVKINSFGEIEFEP